MQHIFIVGSKGIPGSYGGYETFVDKLTEYHQSDLDLKYHIACKNKKAGEFEYHNARCFNIKVPEIGSAQAIYYDVIALIKCCEYIEKKQIEHPVVYILASRIGPLAAWFQQKIHKLGGMVFLNPDGHEYMRAKWPFLVKKYWKISEQLMIKHTDLVICDSRQIERYIHKKYEKYHPDTVFIAYGAETKLSCLADNDIKLVSWFNEKRLKADSYYLVVGRFVPENNFETIIKEFMESQTKRDLVIITTTDKNFMKKLEKKLHFSNDTRIKFVGTMYDQELLKKIREKAYGYIHGHEVGGTNPSLLEAMSSTKLNLLFDVGFNREVGKDGAIYWKKEKGCLKALLEKADHMSGNEISELEFKAKERIKKKYSWKYIAHCYKDIFMSIEKDGYRSKP